MGLSNATHLTMQLCDCNKDKLNDPVFLKQFLDSLPGRVGMTVMQECTPVYLEAENPLDSGWSGVTLLKESHSSFHSFPAMGFCYVDLFSCKSFDHKALVNFISEELEADDYDREVMDRGALFDAVREEYDGRREVFRDC